MQAAIQDLNAREYELIRRLVYAKSGINLGDQKMQLVRARLGKRVREGGFESFGDYVRCVEQDATGEELCYLLDAISTNTTHLFREARHFRVLRETLDAYRGVTCQDVADVLQRYPLQPYSLVSVAPSSSS